jgi:membrane protein YdbS with pleckstrin-like domain
MGLPASQLGPQERIVIETREHLKHLLFAGLICLAAIVGLVLVLTVAPADGFWSWLSSAGWIAFAGVVLVFGVWPFLRWLTRTSTLTNERLVTRAGLIRRTGRDIPLERINDVAYDQGLLDRMTKCGTLRVSAASQEGTVVLRDIPEIHEFVRTMNELVRDARREARFE